MQGLRPALALIAPIALIAIMALSGCAGDSPGTPDAPQSPLVSGTTRSLQPEAEASQSSAPGGGEPLPDPLGAQDHAPGERVVFGETAVTYYGARRENGAYVARFRIEGGSADDLEIVLMPWGTRVSLVDVDAGISTARFAVLDAEISAAYVVVFVGDQGASWRFVAE